MPQGMGFCTNCGMPLKDLASFCISCGNPVGSSNAWQSAQQFTYPPHSSFQNTPANPIGQYTNPISQPAYTIQPFYSDNGGEYMRKGRKKGGCPQCGSENIQLVTEKRAGSASNGCCGAILFGPIGLLLGLCSASQSSKRMCLNCGKKF